MQPGFVITISLISSFFWLFGFSKVNFYIYQLLGSPEFPNILLWVILFSQSFIFGFLPALAVSLLLRNSIKKFRVFYLITLVAFTITIQAVIAGISLLDLLFNSYGFWFFLFGSFIGISYREIFKAVRNSKII